MIYTGEEEIPFLICCCSKSAEFLRIINDLYGRRRNSILTLLLFKICRIPPERIDLISEGAARRALQSIIMILLPFKPVHV